MSPRLALKVFVTCWVVYTAHWAPFIVREHLPAMTLAEAGTLNVERFLGWTEDVFAGPRGGAFINNNPGASMLGAIPLWLARPWLTEIRASNAAAPPASVRDDFESSFYRRAVAERMERYFLTVAFVTAAGAMAASSVAALLIGAGLPRRTTILVVAVCAFGTPIFFRTGYLNHNLLVGHAALCGFTLLCRPAGARRAAAEAGAGACGGFALLCDYSGVLVLGGLAAYAWLRADGSARTTAVGRVALGAAPFAAALLVYQLVAFGDSWLPSQHYMPPIEQTASGYRGLSWPSLALVWANFFDPSFGLFTYCPLLVLALAAPFVGHGRHRVPPREMWVLLGFFGAFVAFCAANQYSWLQGSTGMRYLVPVVPGLTVLSLQVLQAAPRWLRHMVLIPTLVYGWLLALTQARLPTAVTGTLVSGPRFSWADWMYQLGLFDYPDALTLGLLTILALGLGVAWRPELRCAS